MRKGVLLRLPEELLARIDRKRGTMTRTAWITAILIRAVEK